MNAKQVKIGTKILVNNIVNIVTAITPVVDNAGNVVAFDFFTNNDVWVTYRVAQIVPTPTGKCTPFTV